jgi:alcohol dehydrogenase class IV
VTGALGSRCAGVFTGIVRHVPRCTVDALQAEIERVDADCLVSFGGGRPIGSCKVAIHGVSALTMDTADWLWVSTRIRALDHAIEYVYAICTSADQRGPCRQIDLTVPAAPARVHDG